LANSHQRPWPPYSCVPQGRPGESWARRRCAMPMISGKIQRFRNQSSPLARRDVTGGDSAAAAGKRNLEPDELITDLWGEKETSRPCFRFGDNYPAAQGWAIARPSVASTLRPVSAEPVPARRCRASRSTTCSAGRNMAVVKRSIFLVSAGGARRSWISDRPNSQLRSALRRHPRM